eukprot:3998961-Prymnesium_polylepis.1
MRNDNVERKPDAVRDQLDEILCRLIGAGAGTVCKKAVVQDELEESCGISGVVRKKRCDQVLSIGTVVTRSRLERGGVGKGIDDGLGAEGRRLRQEL